MKISALFFVVIAVFFVATMRTGKDLDSPEIVESVTRFNEANDKSYQVSEVLRPHQRSHSKSIESVEVDQKSRTIEQTIKNFHKEIILDLQDTLLLDNDINERLDAITHLENIGGKEALTVIAKGLGDENSAVRSRVIEAFGEAGNDALHLLGSVLFSEPEPALRLQAIEVIAGNISPGGLAFLRSVSENDSDEAVRARASEMISSNEIQAVDPPVTEEPGLEKYTEIMQQINSLDPKEGVVMLKRILSEASNPYIREEAILILANMDENVATLAIANALGDNDTEVRFQAIHSLANSEDDTLHFLGQVLYNDPDPVLRLEAVEKIAAVKGPANRALLNQAIKDSDENVRQTARKYLNAYP